MSAAASGTLRPQTKDKRNDKLGKREGPTPAKPVKEKDDRDARINYTLDMVVHDLVSQGHLHPAKSYLLKTPEMKEHIGRMCDQLNRRKKEDIINKRVNLIPKSLMAPNGASSNLNNLTRSFALMKKAESASKDDINKKMLSSRSATVLPNNGNASATSPSSPRPEMVNVSRKIEPWVTPRDITDEKPRRPVVSKTEGLSGLKLNKMRKQLATLQTSDAAASNKNEATAQAYRAKVDMSGFTNEEISLDLDDRKLMITAQRAKKGSQNSRKVTEIIEIPVGVDLENLKIGRRLDGCLLIEEFVPGVDNNS